MGAIFIPMIYKHSSECSQKFKSRLAKQTGGDKKAF
jgi:hypothetical protein